MAKGRKKSGRYKRKTEKFKRKHPGITKTEWAQQKKDLQSKRLYPVKVDFDGNEKTKSRRKKKPGNMHNVIREARLLKVSITGAAPTYHVLQKNGQLDTTPRNMAGHPIHSLMTVRRKYKRNAKA